ncbi:MAG: hypothetical protein ACYCW6_10095 [Candidatus Xenobia bacterium]
MMYFYGVTSTPTPMFGGPRMPIAGGGLVMTGGPTPFSAYGQNGYGSAAALGMLLGCLFGLAAASNRPCGFTPPPQPHTGFRPFYQDLDPQWQPPQYQRPPHQFYQPLRLLPSAPLQAAPAPALPPPAAPAAPPPAAPAAPPPAAPAAPPQAAPAVPPQAAPAVPPQAAPAVPPQAAPPQAAPALPPQAAPTAPPQAAPAPTPASQPAPAPAGTAPAPAPRPMAERLDDFSARLRGASGGLTETDVVTNAIRAGLDEPEARNFLRFMGKERGSWSGNIDFHDQTAQRMLDVYVRAGKSNGDIRAFAGALRQYSDTVPVHLNHEMFDALRWTACNPQGADTLKGRIGDISGFWGSGAHMDDGHIKHLLDAWQTLPAADWQASNAGRTQEMVRRLRMEGSNVSQDRVRIVAAETGTANGEDGNFLTWMQKNTSGHSLDFTDDSTIHMADIYSRAGYANGNVNQFAGALRQFSDTGLKMREDMYNALAWTACNPQGADQLREQVRHLSGYWGSGSHFDDDRVKDLLDAWVMRR